MTTMATDEKDAPKAKSSETWYSMDEAKIEEVRQAKAWMQDANYFTRVMVSPDSSQSGPMILGGLQGMDGLGGAASKEKEEAVKAEMGVMREDLELLRHAVQARKAGKLEVGELAEARLETRAER